MLKLWWSGVFPNQIFGNLVSWGDGTLELQRAAAGFYLVRKV